MEIGSFETSAFNRRQLEKQEAVLKSPLTTLMQMGTFVSFLGLFAVAVSILSMSLSFAPFLGNILTPSRFLILLTLSLIGLTPFLKKRKQAVFPVDVRAPVRVSGAATMREEDVPTTPVRYWPLRAEMPSRFELVQPTRRAQVSVSPAPFVDGMHSRQKHEYSDLLPVWARKFEDMILVPHILIPLVESLTESDRVLSDVFSKFGFRLESLPSPGVVCLTDRFLPNPLCTIPEVTALWNRRLALENILCIPNFPNKRDYVLSRISTWTKGIRYAYRPDFVGELNAPTDSHILSHLIFVSFDSQMGGASFEDKFVQATTRAARDDVTDEFQSMFKTHHSKVAWLEQTTSTRGLHFNVATHQKIFGVPPGSGNLIEALCLLFHLLRKLSPTNAWLQIPHEVRVALDAIVQTVSGGIGSGLTVSRPALSGYSGF